MAAPTSRAAGAVWALLHQRPDLLLEHAQAYADLLRDESTAWAAYWVVKLLWYTGAVLLAGVGLTLAGVAVMLAGVLPLGAVLLISVPGVTLLAAFACLWAAQRGPSAPGLDETRAQWEADRSMLSPGGS
jgi:hypothetical protein